MIRLITFSDENMTASAEVCCESAKANGVDEAVCINDRIWKDEENYNFYLFNKGIIEQKRGCGYWIWKPFIIASEMTEMNDGDILIYSDAGVKWINNVSHIIDAMDQDIFLFSNGHQHVHWCKADVIAGINPFYCQENGKHIAGHYEQFQQVQASVIFFKVNDNTRRFVKEWLLFCQMPGFIDDSPSKLPNHPEFAEHRHDQAVLTCLAIKYGYRLHWWPDRLWYSTQRHRWPEDNYPAMLEHHRKRNPGKGGGVNPEW